MNKLIRSVILSIIMVMALSSPVLAREFESQQNIALDKVWKINFSQVVDGGAAAHITLYRIDTDPETKVDIAISRNSDKKDTLLVGHTDPFAAGAKYRLTVGSDAISESGTKIKEDVNLYFETIKPTDNLIPDKEKLEDIQAYISDKYSSVTIDGKTIKYNIIVDTYPGNNDGTHVGSAFIMLNTTQDTVFTQGYVIKNCPDDYFEWVEMILEDIDSHYGEYQYNGGIWTSLTNGYQVMFENWSGEGWRYTVPK